jgi:hypothetical protein
MFKSQQYRAKAAGFGQLAMDSTSAEESQKFKELEDSFISLADKEQTLADKYENDVHASKECRAHGEALAEEEEYVLRCLGAAVVMQWNTLPMTLQRELFDSAGSVGKLLETASLRGHIARFLHKHKSEGGSDKL